MLLSIVMMIKNEEKNLDRTLSALNPLITAVNSEIIILDTGSTDNSINIAKKYTDKVYFEEWNNDFAEMRNKSIGYANGDWILILDADEELIECGKLIKFFTTDLCEKYNTATIDLKSIFSEDKKAFNITSIPRLFKKYEEFKYVGSIHEQPLWKEPIYNGIAFFDHYGYLFVDEELRQKKSKRNKEILLKEIKKNKNDPYLNYQLGKEYIISKNYEEALLFLEKSNDIYKKKNMEVIYVINDLADLYLNLNKLSKCKKLCLEYIKKDKNNIDIYYYLATVQRRLYKYDESNRYYERYRYLFKNYDISTQANDIRCTYNTASNIVESEINIINNYYDLEDYSKVISEINKISEEAINQLYFVIIMSFKKLNKYQEILNLYDKYCLTQVEKNKFYNISEAVIANSNENEKKILYKTLSNINSNYGILNKVRLGLVLDFNETIKVLNEENQWFYSDIILNYIKEDNNIYELLSNLDRVKLEGYINNLINNRKEVIFDLYNLLINNPIILEFNSLKVNSCLAKGLLIYGNLIGDKYEKLFNIYITCHFEYLRMLYNSSVKDEDLINLVDTIENKFIIEVIVNEKIKETRPLEYIKKLKKLIIENPNYKKALENLVNKFKKEFNENDEVKKLKKQFKNLIEENINKGMYDVCYELIKQYEELYCESDLYNIKGILSIYTDELEEAQKWFKLAYCLDRNNEDTLFNIAYLNEITNNFVEAISFYEKLLNLNNSDDISEKVSLLKEIISKDKKEVSDKVDIDYSTVKSNIEELINENRLEEAQELLDNYKVIYADDISIYSMQGIILLNNNEINLACDSFLKGLELDSKNVDLLYNAGYCCILLNLKEEAIYYYNKCFNITNDKELKKEIRIIIEQLQAEENKNKKQTFITIDLKDNDELFKVIKEDLIKIKINEEVEYNNRTYEDSNIIYETNSNNLNELIEYILRNNENCIVVFNDYKIKRLLDFKEKCKFIYYTNKNLVIDKEDYLNQNINILFENEVCNDVNFIFTNNIEVYYFKNKIEKRDNVYLIDDTYSKEELKCIINNNIMEEQLKEKLRSKLNEISDEYEKSLYLLLIEKQDLNKCLEISKYIYDKYKNESAYIIYLSLLNESNNYSEILVTMINSEFCDDIYKAEVLYLNSIEEIDLISFILNISIKNYKSLDFNNNVDYKMATYFYELNMFEKAYYKYMIIINDNNKITISPLVSRNIAFLMYKNADPHYESFYNNYRKLIDIVNKENDK
ncbi:glycosyltransferase [Clostridium sp.]|uniref:glycosyltransferase n=1 Tax=Clostridium sp. TaxID=1506 RepID=UPI0026312346|nr:glycosyltransferase [Clostridium sp.]